MDERTNILRILSDRKIFLIKGAVPRVARMLGCSEPTVYRGIKSCEAMNRPTAAAGLKLEQHIKTAASEMTLENFELHNDFDHVVTPLQHCSL